MQNAKFYCFPFYRKPLLMYRGGAILNSEIFKVFFFKLFRSRVLLRWRKESLLMQRFGERLSFREVSIPNGNIQLIYRGYDTSLMFEMNDAGSCVRAVWRESAAGEFQREAFIGYPVFYDYKTDAIKHHTALLEYLQMHWSRMKAGYSCHGDMTHYNLLVDSFGRIQVIDEKLGARCPILTDLFYFYSFFRDSLDKQVVKSSNRHRRLVEQLDALFGEVFKGENRDLLFEALAEINPSHLGNRDALSYTGEFKQAISSRLETK